ncbi:MAG: hypothetical protein WA324_29135 [Bryobacteraceae bacterium]
MVIDTSEWTSYIKEKVERGKEDAFVWYSIGARWFLLGNFLLYFAGCIVAGGMIGPVRYIEFLYHASHFEQPAPMAVSASNPAAEKPKRPPVLNPNASF